MNDGELDELFGGGTGQPQPRSRLILGLLVAGVTLTAAGMLCTAVPGGLVVLIAWHQVEKESERLEAGFLAPGARPAIQQMQTLTYASVFLVLLLFTAQTTLFVLGFYDSLWQAMILMVFDTLETLGAL